MIFRSLLSQIAGLAGLFLFAACGGGTPAGPTPDPGDFGTAMAEDTAFAPVHVTFSGGGWRAHTTHSAWTLSLLQQNNSGLDDAFANVRTVSSNSGGSWFSTMLMYSPAFIRSIEAADAPTAWGETGWLGQQRALFNDVSICSHLSGNAFMLCVSEYYTGEKGTRWRLLVEDLVFHDYPLGGTTLADPHQPWATDKALLLASTLLTTQVVLNGELLGEKQYYQACQDPAQPRTDGHRGSSCGSGPAYDVLPVTFASVPAGAGTSAPPFFASLGGNGGLLHLGYSTTADFDPATAGAALANPVNAASVPAVIAAAASSAAAGFGASGRTAKYWDAAYELEDAALSFRITDGNLRQADATGLAVEELADQQFVRLADGGPVDNSGVAQLVSYLQHNDQADGFHIVSFDDAQKAFTPPGGAHLGANIASLFGVDICSGNDFCSGTNCDGVCVATPPLQIFDSTTVHTTGAVWEQTTTAGAGTHQLVYTIYDVVTTDNPDLGVSAGSKGRLHAFSTIWTGADTAPQNAAKDRSFDAYQSMLTFINQSLQADGNRGGTHLREAFGLVPNQDDD